MENKIVDALITVGVSVVVWKIYKSGYDTGIARAVKDMLNMNDEEFEVFLNELKTRRFKNRKKFYGYYIK